MGEGNRGEWEGDLTMSVAFQKIISPSSATFPGRRGSNQAFFSPSLSLCSPLMPPNQPGGDIIILEPGVTVGRTPGAGSLVCECVCMYVCFCVHVCAWQRGRSGHIITV